MLIFDECVEELRHIWEADMVSELADALSFDPADPRVLRLHAKHGLIPLEWQEGQVHRGLRKAWGVHSPRTILAASLV